MIFFDLDGTLTDPKPGITGCIQYALDRLGAPVPEQDDLTWCIGPPLLESLTTLLGDAEAAKSALAHYRERFGETGLYENDLYDGIPDLLGGLQDSGRRLAVATSKPAVYAERIVVHFGLDGFFEAVFGSELDGTRADKTELLRHALLETGAAPDGSTMVGDRSHDVVAACRLGLTPVGVLYGYGGEDELRAAGAERIAARVADLAGLLA